MDKTLYNSLLYSLVTVAISLILYQVIINILDERNNKFIKSKKSRTYIRMFKSTLKYIFIIVTGFILLQINGINVSSMLAGVGIASVIVGFAIQDLLKDIIKGIDILSDQYFQVGDVIKYKDIEGKVKSIGLKSTKVKDVRSLNIVSISNRNIEQVEVVSDLINIDIPMPYELSIKEAEKAIDDILKDIKKIEGVDNCEYRGVNDLAESSINYQIKVYCKPILKTQIRRDSLRCVLIGLDKNGISVPYKQIDMHNK